MGDWVAIEAWKSRAKHLRVRHHRFVFVMRAKYWRDR